MKSPERGKTLELVFFFLVNLSKDILVAIVNYPITTVKVIGKVCNHRCEECEPTGSLSSSVNIVGPSTEP